MPVPLPWEGALGRPNQNPSRGTPLLRRPETAVGGGETTKPRFDQHGQTAIKPRLSDARVFFLLLYGDEQFHFTTTYTHSDQGLLHGPKGQSRLP